MILIKEADIYAPEHLGIRDVLICGERVEAVGENLPALCGCRVIEARGKMLTPGLIDQPMAVDMETATLFSCGFANHIPTGALLLVLSLIHI